MTRTLFKILGLAVLVAAAQIAIGSFAHKRDKTIVASVFNSTIATGDILFFGDSVLENIAPGDADRRDIPGMLSAVYGQPVQTFMHGAFNVSIYLEYVKYLLRKGVRPAVIIVPINLRNFSSEWDTHWLWQFEKLHMFLRYGQAMYAIQTPIAIYTDAFRSIKKEWWLWQTVYDDGRPVGYVRDYYIANPKKNTSIGLDKDILLKYRYRLDPSHRRLAQLAELARLAKSSGIATLFYITAYDRQTCDEYLPGTSAIMRDNAGLVRRTLAREGAPVLDLLESLPSSAFDWRRERYISEHVNQVGRLFIAQELAKSMPSRVPADKPEQAMP